jgi:hypothetical protein
VEHHVVAQIIEAELVVGAVGDVGGVRLLLEIVLHLREIHADAHAEKPVDLPHPVGVALREVVVDRDDMHADAGECIEVCGQGRDERFAFARSHLRNLSVVQRYAAEELDVEVAHVEHALAGLAYDGESLRQYFLEGLAAGAVDRRVAGLRGRRLNFGLVIIARLGLARRSRRDALLDALPELVGLGAQRLVRKTRHFGLERVDLAHRAAILLQQPLIAAAENLLEHALDHGQV